MTFSSIQNGFSSGEMSPRLYGRTDLAKYHLGASTMRNFYVDYRGGASSRAGLQYIGMCKQAAPNNGGTSTSNPPRDIPFQFSISQGYALEFGDIYMRVKSNGAYVTESAKTITGATNANPLVITSAAHGFNNGDWVYISALAGMTELNGLVWIVVNKTTDTFEVTSLFGAITNSTSFGVYTSGGTAARIYTAVSPYAAIDLPFLKYTQSKDVMTLTCVNQQTNTEYPSYELVRNSATNWTFTADTFASSISAPAGISVTANNSAATTTFYSYVVTAINGAGEESVASPVGTIKNNDIAISAGSNVISWSASINATSYNIYGAIPSYNIAVPAGAAFGYIGNAFGAQFVDNNIIADFTIVPPVHNNPFARGAILGITPTAVGASYSQASVGYTITTSSGFGAIIVPVVVNGGVVAYIIQNGGSNYQSTDTIAITGGGGMGGNYARGSYTFNSGNPLEEEDIVLNGITWTFVKNGAINTQTNISTGGLYNTIQQLVSDLNASPNSSINVANYSVGTTNALSITYKITGAIGNSYTLDAGTYAGAVSGATLTGGTAGPVSGATANLIVGPSTGTYPGAVAYYQQRRAYAFTLNDPDTYFMSQPGAFNNMDSSTPTTDSDAIIGAPWAQQINGIQFLVPMPGGLVVLTGKGAWQLNGGTNAAITPADQTASPQAYNGCNAHIQPIVVNYDILYVQAKGSIVRDLSYNFFVNIYTGTDMTVLSEHLFNFHQIQQWAYAEEPYKIVWSVRDDGVLLSLTYLKEQDIYGWARHDTNGIFVSVCSITEPPVDAIYTIVKRYFLGPAQWVYYSERMDDRNWLTVEDCFCVDAGLTLPMIFPSAMLTPAAADGTDNISSLNLIAGGSGYTAPTISAVDPTGQGSGFAATLTIGGGIITGYSISNQGTDYQPGTELVVTDSTGSGGVLAPIITNNVIFNTSASVFTAENVGDVIRIGHSNASSASGFPVVPNGGGKAIITAYTSATRVTANIIQPITNVVPDDPDNTPVPVSSNYWSLSTPVSSVTGLNHLEGMEVAILADGSVVANQVVTDGTVEFQTSYSAITIGLPYICQLQTLYLDPPSPSTVQGKRKNIQAVTVRVENTRGISVGTNQIDASTQPNGQSPAWTNMYEMKQRNANQMPGAPIPLLTGDLRELVGGDWSKPGQIAIQTLYPIGCNILAVLPEFTVGDNNA